MHATWHGGPGLLGPMQAPGTVARAVGPHARAWHRGSGRRAPSAGPSTGCRWAAGTPERPGQWTVPASVPRGTLGCPPAEADRSPASAVRAPSGRRSRRPARCRGWHSPWARTRRGTRPARMRAQVGPTAMPGACMGPDSPSHRARCLHGARQARATVPGTCMGPNTPGHRARRMHGARTPTGPSATAAHGARRSGGVRRPDREPPPPRNPRGPGRGPGPGRSRWPGGRSSRPGPTRGRPRGRRRCARGG